MDGHPHLHFTNWTRTRIRSKCTTDETKVSTCPQVATGRKTSFCLEDFSDFDGSITTGNGPHGCTNTNGLISQGISAGKEDVYEKYLTGQVTDISSLASGDYYLEVEVNPDHILQESDYTNNVSHVVFHVP
jgi:hypothetical protein